MDYRPLGRTGVSVSQMCLGAMMFGAFGNPDHHDAIKIIHKALDAGINFIDTADGYSAGESEEILGEALAGGRRESVVLAVKFGPPFDEDPSHRGASRRWITEGVEGSLRRLQTDWIDLYQVGVPDPNTDIDETLGALTDLVRAGKIRYFGASKVPASQIVEAQWTAGPPEKTAGWQSPLRCRTRFWILRFPDVIRRSRSAPRPLPATQDFGVWTAAVRRRTAAVQVGTAATSSPSWHSCSSCSSCFS